jgi:hypothetical protein
MKANGKFVVTVNYGGRAQPLREEHLSLPDAMEAAKRYARGPDVARVWVSLVVTMLSIDGPVLRKR